MAVYDDLSLHIRLFMKSYPFSLYALKTVPCAPFSKEPNQARFALITTAGLHLSEQPGFDHSIKMGDCSFREIPNSVDTQKLTEAHKSKSFDHSGVQADRNLAFPLDRFRELVANGEVGELNHRHFSFMGSIIAPRRLIEETGPQVARLLREDEVDAVFLAPV